MMRWLAWNIPPVTVELKMGVEPIRKKQNLIPRPTLAEIKKHLERLLKYGILEAMPVPLEHPTLNSYKTW